MVQAVASPDGNTMPSLTEDPEIRETDDKVIAHQSSNTIKHHGQCEKSRRDARGDDNSSIHSSRDIASESRDAEPVSKERNHFSTSSQEKSSVNSYKAYSTDDGYTAAPSYFTAMRTWFGDDAAVSVTSSIAPSVAPSVQSTSAQSKVSKTNSVNSERMSYLSSLSVVTAIAVMQAKGSDELAKTAADTVLGAREKEPSTSSLSELATDVSMSVLKAGGDPAVAAAATVAIMEYGDDPSLAAKPVKETTSKKDTDSSDAKSVISFQPDAGHDDDDAASVALSVADSIAGSIAASVADSIAASVAGSVAASVVGSIKNALSPQLHGRYDVRDDASVPYSINASLAASIGPSVAASISPSFTSSYTPSVTPSMEFKRGELKQKEIKIARKAKALKEAEMVNRKKEKDLRARLAALDAAEVALLDEANIDLIVKDRMSRYESSQEINKPESQNDVKPRFGAPRGFKSLRGRSNAREQRPTRSTPIATQNDSEQRSSKVVQNRGRALLSNAKKSCRRAKKPQADDQPVAEETQGRKSRKPHSTLSSGEADTRGKMGFLPQSILKNKSKSSTLTGLSEI